MPTTKNTDPLSGRDPETQLYRAVRRYVESRGGKLIVIGGVRIIRLSGDPKLCFHLSVKCTGQEPDKPKP